MSCTGVREAPSPSVHGVAFNQLDQQGWSLPFHRQAAKPTHGVAPSPPEPLAATPWAGLGGPVAPLLGCMGREKGPNAPGKGQLNDAREGFTLAAVPVKPLQAHSPCILGLVQALGGEVLYLARGEVFLRSVCAGKCLVRFAKGQKKFYGRYRVTP